MKKPITLFAVLVMLLAATESRAASCKYQWDTNNYRTGETVSWTRWVRNKTILSGGIYGMVAGVREGDKSFLALQVVSFDRHEATRPTKADIDSAMVIPEDSKLSILLADGTIFDLYSAEHVDGDTSIVVNGSEPDDDFVMGRRSGYTFDSHAIVKFELSAEAIAALIKQKATDMRLHTPDRNYDITFGSKPSDKIQEVIACIPAAE